MTRTQTRQRWLLSAGVGVWIAAVSAGALGLARYANTAGPTADAQEMWPVTARIPHGSGMPTLVMSLHPQCPCSRASVDELEQLAARCPGLMSVDVLLIDYPSLNSDIKNTELWKSASRIPGVVCVRDEQGKISDAFHAETSGQVFLYDTDGVMQFHGGITGSRGHDGDNDGLLAIEAILHHATPTTRATPVFGCALR